VSRARVAALALVNWKGVFFERYLLDKHVTALEGANGAGKTTVMIAAYVVLLPDMTRLRFTNLGESGATGGDRGIWGRLGEPGRPSYAALDIDLQGQRVLLGVCLTRATEPTVEPTAFIVTGLAESVRLSDLLLSRRDDGDHVPELAELKLAAAKLGGEIQVFRSVKDYFTALFERGITPLCLSFEEERNKWNDLLRTSMTGGISRALGTELRSFLLRQETGLSDTLSRMRENLESCRRTRLEVFEARQLEREISAIYEAGLAMFSAALHASRAASLEANARARDAAEARLRARRLQAELSDVARELQRTEQELAQKSEHKREELAQLEAAKQRRQASAQLSQRVVALDAELEAAIEKLTAATAHQEDKESARQAAQQAREWSLEAYDRASIGLSSLQKGLEELARRAHAHKELTRCLDEARELTARPELAADDVEPTLAELAQRRGEHEAERATLTRQARDLDVRRREHREALEALEALTSSDLLASAAARAPSEAASPAAAAGELVPPEVSDASPLAAASLAAAADELGHGEGSDASPLTAAGSNSAPALPERDAAAEAHARARALLALASELDAGSARLEQLEAELRTARRLRVRQVSARALATELGLSTDLVGDETDHNLVPESLSALERELSALEESLRVDAEALTARQRLVALRDEHAALDRRAAVYRLAEEAVLRLAQAEVAAGRDAGAPVLESQTALLAFRDKLLSEQLALSAQRDALEAARERMQAEAAELNRGGAVYDAELLRVRDELGAELLAARFEDLEPEQAAWVQARLGPWVDALVVDDVSTAAEQLDKIASRLPSVHLVQAGESLDVAPPERGAPRADEAGRSQDHLSGEPALRAHRASEAISGKSLRVQEAFGTRITQLPAAASLGRRAREAKLATLWDSIAEHATQLEQLGTAVQRNAAQRRDADVLWTHAAVFLGENPQLRQQQLEQELVDLETREQAREAEQSAARARLSGLRSHAEGLRRLLPDAQLLGSPDYAQRERELETERLLAARARAELAQLSAARATLAGLLDVLRSPPPDDAALAAQAARLSLLERELDRIFRARSALEGVLALRHAAQFADAQAALDAQAELSPALEQQQKQARSQLKAAESQHTAALRGWETATGSLQAVQAEKAALQSQRERLQQELYELGGHAGEALDSAELQLEAANAALLQLTEAARRSVAERALAEERRTRAAAELQAAEARQTQLTAEAEPIERTWNALRDAAESAGVLHAALSSSVEPGHGSTQLRAEASSKRELLLDRVARARGADELQQLIRSAGSDLESWQAVRAFLGRRVPAQIAQVDEPLLALQQLSDHLDMLEARLTRQEGDLRGNSEDVARAIGVQLRRALGQVRRLNQQLDGIRFGSIHGIRIEMRRIERMEQILRALSEGQAQELLFSSNLPIEEALDEIFKRYGGGGKSGGQRLLDYREYLELTVEIRRQNAEAWEPANPTRLSTGEAIGVGAALMMVVLTEWERAANLLGPRNKPGSLRFLFLDEANRLSRDNLGVLFDLCRTLDLQLLVAAPEVARADGNTTYRLVRHTTADGREEVIVSGRRSVPVKGDEPGTDEAHHEATEEESQASLLHMDSTDAQGSMQLDGMDTREPLQQSSAGVGEPLPQAGADAAALREASGGEVASC
jgi:chromosome partition protein MukB